MRVRLRSKFFIPKNRLPRRDFSFQSVSANPHRAPDISQKTKLLLPVIGIVLIILAGLLIFHPAFQIQVITIHGLQRIEYAEIHSTAVNILHSNYFRYLPRNNYFLVDTLELQEIISDRFLLKKVEIKKKFPSSLQILVEERQPVMIVLKENSFIAVDINGQTVEKLGYLDINSSSTMIFPKSSSREWKDFSLLIYPQGIEVDEDKAKKIVTGALAWNNFINDSLKTNVVNYTLETGNNGVVKTTEGWKILINLIDNRDEQFTALNAVLKQKNFDIKNVDYIDVRYPGKVYWQ